MSSQTERAAEFFTKINNDSSDKTVSFYQCNLCTHKKPVNGTSKSNLLKHLANVHREIYQLKINFDAKNAKDDIKKKRLEFMQHLVEMVTINKMPFSALLSSGFKKIVAQKLDEFEKAGLSVDLNGKNLKEVKSRLRQTAIKVREAIKKEVGNDHFSLSTDIGSKNNRSCLSIYATYISDGVQRVRCIGMKELLQRHTGKYLFTVIEDCLAEFGWKTLHTISLTTDNASNMKTLVNCMNDNLNEANSITNNDQSDTERAEQNGKSNDDYMELADLIHVHTDGDIADILHQLNIDDENEIEALLNDCDDENVEYLAMDPMHSEIIASFENALNAPMICVNAVNCAAHTVQLAVKDALRLLDESSQNVIGIARAVVKFLRKESTRNEIRNRGLAMTLPPLDVATRWSSTYMMVRKYYFSEEKITNNIYESSFNAIH